MFGRLTWVQVDMSDRAAVDHVADRFQDIVSQQKGFVSVTMFLDAENDRVGDLTVWETKEDMQAWADKDVPELKEKFAPLARGGLTRDVFEIYKSGG